MMKPLIAALALVTLFASPTFARPAARPSTQTEFVFPTDEQLCRSGQTDFCHWRGDPHLIRKGGALRTPSSEVEQGRFIIDEVLCALRPSFGHVFLNAIAPVPAVLYLV